MSWFIVRLNNPGRENTISIKLSLLMLPLIAQQYLLPFDVDFVLIFNE